MHNWRWIAAVALMASAAPAQDPQQKPGSRADSIAQATADSIALVRKFEAMQATNAQVPPSAAPTGGSAGPTNPRMLPDFSAVGDLVGDLTSEGSTQADGTRFGVREVELAVQSAVDPFFRGDVFPGVSAAEGISIEQAFLTTTSLPWRLQAQLGRFLMPVSKLHATHRHDLHTIEYPWVLQRHLSDDGLKVTGVSVSKIFSPFGFRQALIVGAVDRFGERPDSLRSRAAAGWSSVTSHGSTRFVAYTPGTIGARATTSAFSISGVRSFAGTSSPGYETLS